MKDLRRRRYSLLLNEEIPYYFTSTEPYYSRGKPQKGEKDSESISRHFQLTLATTGTMWFTSSPSLKVGAAEAFWRNFDLRDGGPKAAGRLL